MVEPAVTTVCICLPSIWPLVVECFKRLPTTFRSKWSKQSTTLVNSTKWRSEVSRLPSNETPASPARSKLASQVGRATLVDDIHFLVDTEESDSPVSGRPSPIADGETPEDRRWPASNSMEIESRVRNYYDGATFDYGSRNTVHQYWDSGWDLEVRPSPLSKNRLAVPPKD